MADLSLRAESVPGNSALVTAFIRAFDLSARHDDASPDNPDAQFAWGAYEGARQRMMRCYIHSLDHVAAAVLVAVHDIETLISGFSIQLGDDEVILRADAERELRDTKKALTRIWAFLAKRDDVCSDPLLAIASAYGIAAKP